MNQETLDKLAECLPVLDQQISEAEAAFLAAESRLRSLKEERQYLGKAMGLKSTPSPVAKPGDYGAKSLVLRNILRANPGITTREIKALAGSDGRGNFPHSNLSNWIKAGTVTRDSLGRYSLIEKHPLGAK